VLPVSNTEWTTADTSLVVDPESSSTDARLVAVGVSARSSLEKVRWGLPLPGSLQSISFGDYTFDCAKDCSNEICEVLGTKTSSGTLHAISMLGCAAKITKMYGTSLSKLSLRASVTNY
jgi:hypothetical protein